MPDREATLPVEEFIQALTSQLDRAQRALALKARAGIPLTFAVKDVSLDLKTHVDFVGSAVHLRPAGPGDADASTLRFSLTTVTRPMMEENAQPLSTEADEQSLQEVFGEEISEEDRRRLEWAGIHTVSQLRKVQKGASEAEISRVAQIPALRLRAALAAASRPHVDEVSPIFTHPERPPELDRRGPGREPPPDGDRPVPRGEGRPELDRRGPESEPRFVPERPTAVRIRGRNLVARGRPSVRLGAEKLRVLSATDRELVVEVPVSALGGPDAPAAALEGVLEIEAPDGTVVTAPLVFPGPEDGGRT